MPKGMQQKQPAAKRATSRIPSFKTVEEEAAFWDRHDSAEFEDEFEDVTDVRLVKGLRKRGVTVRLDAESMAALSDIARSKGLGLSTLARMWILERLRGERRPSRRAG